MLDQDLGLSERAKYLTIEKFVAEPGIEALAVSILPRRSWLDGRGLGSDGLSDAFWVGVRANEGGHAAQDEQVRLLPGS